nr:DNA-directed RNA polymerase I subunit RPA43 [Ipomoea batatas]
MDALKQCEANFVAYLHPSKSKHVKDAVYRELSSLLFKFDEALDGVVLAYEPKFHSNLAKILPGIHPYFGVRFQAKLLLFNPKQDMLLEGEVVKVCLQSIHIVVLGFSSAIIADEDVHREFKYKIKHGEEVFVSKSHRRHKIKVGTVVRFSVKSFDEEILHICGSLISADTGNVSWLESNREAQTKSDPKKSGSERPVEKLEYGNGRIGEENMNADNQPKKSKRRKLE